MKAQFETNFPPTQISGFPAIIIFLIKEEIRNFTFVKRLEDIGFDSTFFSSHLGSAILSLMDFGEHTDDLLEWYCGKLNHYTEEADITDKTQFNNVAFHFYIDLETERRMRSTPQKVNLMEVT